MTNEIRPEKIAQAKQRIADGYYNRPEVIRKATDVIADKLLAKLFPACKQDARTGLTQHRKSFRRN